MLRIQKRCSAAGRFDAELVLPYELRQKCRLRTQTPGGEEAGLFLPRGTVLRDGDLLEADDGRIVRITARTEDVLQITCGDARQLARIAYHLGNRHVALQVGDGWLRIADDYVLREMVEGLGATVAPLQAPFDPEAGAYGAHRHEGPEAPAHRGIIHQYVPVDR
ncbi:MAG TPA: urease accessory protein UreE [Burkholderiales bacterium]|nr:urease accessory protein UreE [Burkholderiales bacterium]